MDLDVFVAQYNKRKAASEQIEDVHYLTADEYAERTHRSAVTVRVMCRNGEIEGAVKVGKLWRIPVKDTADMQNLKKENIRLAAENAALRERLGCVKALLELPNIS